MASGVCVDEDTLENLVKVQHFVLLGSFKVYISLVGFLYVLKFLTVLMVMAKEKF